MILAESTAGYADGQTRLNPHYKKPVQIARFLDRLSFLQTVSAQ